MGSKYFSDSELACKCCGQLPVNGMDERLLQVLDAIRGAVGAPVSISCAYRCPSHNAEVGGVPNSQHVQGCAADVLVPNGMSVNELAEIAEQCGADGIGRYYDSLFVHIDTRGYAARWSE
ncbi:YcbK family protein [Sporomusa aerivorans]|uniref:YcbK family protein n=1 Tax=Sporomusa aerivorans TaxID=204936 RepID=UPI00352A563A